VRRPKEKKLETKLINYKMKKKKNQMSQRKRKKKRKNNYKGVE